MRTLRPPFAPMEARPVAEPPRGKEWQYEPKWDGFRCLVFRGRDVYLQSKSGRPLARYFPDVVEAVKGIGAGRFVLDGEIVIPVAGRLSFDELLLRVHPAASRVRMLSGKHPAMLVLFDLLEEEGEARVSRPLSERRAALERFAARRLRGRERVRLSPATRDISVALRWLGATGGNLDGIIAKRLDLPYQSGNREGMQKIKRRRTADCVVGGFRYGVGKRVVGSLLLGLYDKDGLLNHVGFTSSFAASDRAAITKLVEKERGGVGFTGKAPGGPSRWSTRESDDWEPMRGRLVVEVEYDHFSGGRFRHGTRMLRWRADKRPRECTLEQVKRGAGVSLSLLGASRPRRARRK